MASKDHGLTPIELSSFCSEIALMLGAGMPLYAGMEALEKTYEDDAHAALYRGVSETLTQTGSLRDALESAHAFPTYLVEMCGVGERTGHLEDVMRGLSVYYERESRIRQAVRSAVTYPLVLAVMMVLILLVLILKVMPVFRTVLGSMGAPLLAFVGAVLVVLGLPLLLAKRHPLLISGWLLAAASFLLFNPWFVRYDGWTVLGGLLYGYVTPVLLIPLARDVLMLVLSVHTWRALRQNRPS